MSQDFITLLTAILGIVSGVISTVLVKGRLGDVIASRSDQDKRAVNTMADILEKAIESYAQLSIAVESLAAQQVVQRHDQNAQFEVSRRLWEEIKTEVRAISEKI